MILDGYVRVSQVGDRAGQSFISPVAQREYIERWASRHGVLIGVVFEEFNWSGGRSDRPQWRECIARVERGESGGVVVAYLSRFGRSMLDGLEAIERITAAGGRFVSVEENVDFSTDTGRLVLRLMFAVAEWERDRIRSIWNDARRRAVERGAWLGHRPFGYQRPCPGPLEQDPVEGPLVTELFRRRADGAPLAELCRFMGATGVPTNGGGSWSSSKLRSLFKLRLYCGEQRSGRYLNLRAHPPLIDELTWQRAQRAPQNPARRDTPDALLRGILRCAGCRRPLRGCKGSVSSIYASRWYGCKDIELTAPCRSPASVTDAQVEPYVEELFWQELSRARPSRKEKRVERLEREAEKREQELIAYRDNPALPRTLGSSRFAQGLAIRTERLERQVTQLWTARTALGRAKLPAVSELRKRWPSLTLRERRAAIADVLEAAFLFPGFCKIEDRLYVYRWGDAPADLPPLNPRRRFDSHSFHPADCPPPVRLRRSSEAWNEQRLRAELEPFLAGRDRWPRFGDFQQAGLGLLYRQVQLHGGHRSVVEALNLDLPLPIAGWGRDWPEDRVRRELHAYVEGKPEWPSCKQFRADGHERLRTAVNWYGGPERWANEMGFLISRKQRTQPTWNYLKLRRETAAFTEGRTDWPTKAEFDAAGRETLYYALIRHRARDRLAAELGLYLPPGRRRTGTPRGWDDETIKAGLDQILPGRDTWPTWSEFEVAGLRPLRLAISKSGTAAQWAKAYGLPPPRLHMRRQATRQSRDAAAGSSTRRPAEGRCS